jgi:chloramphenicol-sensitive protein RarD
VVGAVRHAVADGVETSGWWRELRDNPKRLAILALSGTLIAANWLTYVWSVNNGRMLEASLGYYINPLVNVLLGMLILGERLRRMQWIAVGLAAVGVAQQVWQVGSLPWVSLVLALTFGFYGLIRKQAPVKACRGWWWKPGCWCRSPWPGCCSTRPQPARNRSSGPPRSLVAGRRRPGDAGAAGVLQRRHAHLPYTTIGFLQYLAPTLVLLQAVLLFGEHLSSSTLVAFIFIWAGLAVYSVDAWSVCVAQLIKKRTNFAGHDSRGLQRSFPRLSTA